MKKEQQTTRQLSAEAIREFQEIYREEFGEALTDDDAEEKGISLLRLFKTVYTKQADPEPLKIEVSEPEFQALKYIHFAVYHDRQQPTVRGIAEALGLSSSRSGFRMLQSLMRRGLVYRDNEGKVCMREDVAGCETGVHKDLY